MPSSRLHLLVAVVLAALLTGCISSKPSSSPVDRPVADERQDLANRQAPASQGDAERVRQVETDLRAVSSRWDGVPHRWGGTTRRGVDCSGLVQNVYAEVFGLQLPRTTKRQARVGTEVDRSALQPGDLVFFRPGPKKRHVGVYLSGGEFVHASSSSGVTVSQIDNAYWDDRWWQARRIVRTMDRPSTAADTTSTPSSAQRAGW